jgi:hypothetical protein
MNIKNTFLNKNVLSKRVGSVPSMPKSMFKPWEAIFKAQFGGTLISKLYNGLWDMEDVLKNVKFHVTSKQRNFGKKHVNFFQCILLCFVRVNFNLKEREKNIHQPALIGLVLTCMNQKYIKNVINI